MSYHFSSLASQSFSLGTAGRRRHAMAAEKETPLVRGGSCGHRERLVLPLKEKEGLASGKLTVCH